MSDTNVKNGSRAELAMPFYTGPAGARERGSGLEISYFGNPPRLTADNREGRFGDRAIRVSSAIESRQVRNMVVLSATLIP